MKIVIQHASSGKLLSASGTWEENPKIVFDFQEKRWAEEFVRVKREQGIKIRIITLARAGDLSSSAGAG